MKTPNQWLWIAIELSSLQQSILSQSLNGLDASAQFSSYRTMRSLKSLELVEISEGSPAAEIRFVCWCSEKSLEFLGRYYLYKNVTMLEMV
jgi:hypothetical protein